MSLQFPRPDVRTNIHFYHSLVVCVCDLSQHFCDEMTHIRMAEQSPALFVHEEGSTNAASTSQSVRETLDLHTNTSLIGRAGLDITLHDLHLADEAIDGCVDIYAVVRQGEADGDVIGLDAHYRYANCWVSVVEDNTNIQKIPSPDSQCEEGYACFLSCLRVFAALFDAQNLSTLDKSKQNLLLRNLTESLRFPPAVRCMYALINRQTSPPEDRAALVQSLFLYGRTLHEIATRGFDFRDSQIIFKTLYRQLSPRNPEPVDFFRKSVSLRRGF